MLKPCIEIAAKPLHM